MEHASGDILMEEQEFKINFNDEALKIGFTKAYSGWFKESLEVIAVLHLQKSNFSRSYYLNIKLFIKGLFGRNLAKSKQLVKTECGDILIRPPAQYAELFDLGRVIK